MIKQKLPDIIKRDLIVKRGIPFPLEMKKPIRHDYFSEKDLKLEFAYQRYLIKKLDKKKFI